MKTTYIDEPDNKRESGVWMFEWKDGQGNMQSHTGEGAYSWVKYNLIRFNAGRLHNSQVIVVKLSTELLLPDIGKLTIKQMRELLSG